MIPILYEGTETNFTNNGLGRLADAISCIVVEERNATYELEMQYPVTGIHFAELAEGRIILARPFDGGTKQPFTIYSITKPLNGIVTVKAQHISYILSGIVVMPFTATSCIQALTNVGTYSSTTNPFTFSTDKQVNANFKLEKPTAARAILGGSSGSILDVYGKGDYEFDRFSVILHTNRGADNGVTLRYGKNITDLKAVMDMSNVYTGIVPYWSDSEGHTVTLTEKVVLSEHVNDFPYKIIKPVDFSDKWENAPSESELRTAAQSYVTNNEGWVLKNNINVSFVALWNTEEYQHIAVLERVKMCDTVHIEIPKMGINIASKVIKTDYDVLQERYNSITLGSTYYSLSSIVTDLSNEIKKAEEDQKSFIDKAVEHATELITGGLGGHVVFNLNADGEPQEILIMDTDDINTAVDVIRMNRNGIGFSSSGYNGPFTTAWTIDGAFNANFITAGTMQANRVRTGLLTDETGDNYWNLSTGQFKLSSSTLVDNNSLYSIFANFEAGIAGVKSDVVQCYADYSGSAIPTASNYPASAWTSESEKAAHVGSIYRNTSNGKYYQWQRNITAKLAITMSYYTESATYDYVKFYSKKGGAIYASDAIGGGSGTVDSPSTSGTYYMPFPDDNKLRVYWHSDGSVHNFYGFEITNVTTSNNTGSYSEVSSLPSATIQSYSGTYPSHHPYDDSENYMYEYDVASLAPSGSFAWQEISINDVIGASVDSMRSSITQTADAITAEVSRAQGAEGSLSSRISQNANAISSEVSRAQGVEGSLSSQITQTASQISAKVSTSNLVSTLNSQLLITGNKIELNSDGKIIINGTNFKVDENGHLTANYADIKGNITSEASDGSKTLISQGTIAFYLSGDLMGSIETGLGTIVGGNSIEFLCTNNTDSLYVGYDLTGIEITKDYLYLNAYRGAAIDLQYQDLDITAVGKIKVVGSNYGTSGRYTIGGKSLEFYNGLLIGISN